MNQVCDLQLSLSCISSETWHVANIWSLNASCISCSFSTTVFPVLKYMLIINSWITASCISYKCFLIIFGYIFTKKRWLKERELFVLPYCSSEALLSIDLRQLQSQDPRILSGSGKTTREHYSKQHNKHLTWTINNTQYRYMQVSILWEFHLQTKIVNNILFPSKKQAS